MRPSRYLPLVAWLVLGGGSFADRDNTLIEVDDEISRAMVSIVTDTYAVGSGMQVCPGVFLTNAHVVTEEGEDGIVRTEGFDIVPYSHSGDAKRWTGIGSARDGVRVLSPWLERDPESYDTQGAQNNDDYAFLITDPGVVDRVLRQWGTPMRSRDVVPMLSIESDLLSEASGDRLLDIHLYRRGDRAEDGRRSIVPHRVADRCEIAPISDHRFGHDCPIAGGISGAPLTTTIRDRPFVVGLFYGGVLPNTRNAGSFTDHITRHQAIESPRMCRDYELACGRSCATLDRLGEASLTADREAVRALQAFLTEAGQEPGPVDGLWGGRTASALQAHMEASGIRGEAAFTVDLWERLRQ